MGRTACTEPQCLYKGALYLYLYCIRELLHFPEGNAVLPFMFFITQYDGPFPYEDITQKYTKKGINWKIKNKADNIII